MAIVLMDGKTVVVPQYVYKGVSRMKKITAHIFSDETCIERADSPEIILCEERVYRILKLREIIKYFWKLDAEDYELITIEY